MCEQVSQPRALDGLSDADASGEDDEDVEVDGAHHGPETELDLLAEEGQPHREDHRRAEGYVGPRLGQGEEEDVGNGEEDDGYEEGGHGGLFLSFKRYFPVKRR